jgi:hypothetical protein
MIRCVVYSLRILKMFHGIMNNPVLKRVKRRTGSANDIAVNLQVGTWSGENVCCFIHSSLLKSSMAFWRPFEGVELQWRITDRQNASQICRILTNGVMLDRRKASVA